jgi:hypothetical protein
VSSPFFLLRPGTLLPGRGFLPLAPRDGFHKLCYSCEQFPEPSFHTSPPKLPSLRPQRREKGIFISEDEENSENSENRENDRTDETNEGNSKANKESKGDDIPDRRPAPRRTKGFNPLKRPDQLTRTASLSDGASKSSLFGAARMAGGVRTANSPVAAARGEGPPGRGGNKRKRM